MRIPFGLILAASVGAAGFALAQGGPYRWEDLTLDDPPQLILWRGGEQVGNYRLDSEEFFFRLPGGGFAASATAPPFDVPEWARKKKCACCKTCACSKSKCDCKSGKKCSSECTCGRTVLDVAAVPVPSDAATEAPNYGVVWDKIGGFEKVAINGREVTKAQAEAELEADAGDKESQLPDDSEKVTVAVLSDDPDVLQRARLDWMNPALSRFRANAVEQFYDLRGPEKPMLACGFVDKGTQVIVQKGNRVLWDDYTEGYRGLPTLLAAAHAPQVVKEIRKLDPAYDRSKDPGPHNKSGGLLDAGFDVGAWIVGILLGLLCPFVTLVLLVLGACAAVRLWRERRSV